MKKNILLIGGTKGIGLEIVNQLADTHNVYVASRTNDNLEGKNVHHFTFDALVDDISLLNLPDTLDGLVF